ncbi:hypothetical protein [Baaleninema sp.]|uniref:hypothetical protein n=1 Tax=Baaleninema sp. TaxID=3101197 RepID=UPI003D002C15
MAIVVLTGDDPPKSTRINFEMGRRELTMGDRLKQWQVVVVLAAIVGFAIAPMLERSYPITHSTHFNLSWAFQYQRQFFSGQFYPRWLEFSNFGFGNATFVFYPPLSMVATLPFRMLGLGLAGSLIGSMAAAVALFGGGLYRLARRFYPLWISTTVAVVGMLSPYLTIDIYQRGALGEVWAIAALPWIFWTSHKLIDRAANPPPPPNSPWRHRLSRWGLDPDWDILQFVLAYGALVLSHLPTLLIFTLIWLPFPAWIAPSSRRKFVVLRSYVSLAIAWGATAFFLLPVVADGSAVQLDALYATADYLPQNRLLLSGLWQFAPDLTDHWFDRRLVKPWAMMGVVTVGAIVSDRLERQFFKEDTPTHAISRQQRQTATYWAAASLLALLSTTDLLGWLYSSFSPLQRIQFSWRWLSVATVLVPLLLGDQLSRIVRWPTGLKLSFKLFKAASMVVLWGIVAWHGFKGTVVADRASYDPPTIEQFDRLAEAKQFPEEPQQQPGRPFLKWHWIYPDGLALVDVYEYRAKGVTLPMPPDRIYPLIEWQNGRRDGLTVERWTFGLREFVTNNTTSSERIVRLRTLNYPGWFARLETGKWQAIARKSTAQSDRRPVDRLELSVPSGLSHVTVKYRGTPAERFGTFVSFAVWVSLMGAMAKAKPSSRLRNEAFSSQSPPSSKI